MKILVTGGAGFIGSHVAEHFLAAGHEVAVLDDLSTGHLHNVPESATFFECDIRDPRLHDILAEFRPEIISHHAAQMSVRVSITEPRRDAAINVEGTINLLEGAVQHGVRKVIYASTGGALYGEPKYLPCDEDHPIVPLSHYGISKHTVEHYLELYTQLYGLEYTVLRYPNVFGPRQDPHGEAGVVAIFIGKMLRNESIDIFGDGSQERDFVHVRDVARANVLSLDRGDREIVNLGSNVGTSVNQIYKALAEILNYSDRPQFLPSRPGEVYRIFLTNSRAQEVLGWQPLDTVQSGLLETVDSIRTQDVVVAAD